MTLTFSPTGFKTLNIANSLKNTYSDVNIEITVWRNTQSWETYNAFLAAGGAAEQLVVVDPNKPNLTQAKLDSHRTKITQYDDFSISVRVTHSGITVANQESAFCIYLNA